MNDEPVRRRMKVSEESTDPVVMGLDLALGQTGIILLRGGKVIVEELIDTDKLKLRGLARCEVIASFVAAVVAKHRPAVVAVEGYSMASRGEGFLGLVELGGHVRTILTGQLRHTGGDLYDVPPATLKKFTTGSGNAKKPEMTMAVFRRWNYDAPRSNDNLVDAYALARAAAVLANPSAAPAAHVATLAKSHRRFPFLSRASR